MDIELFNKQLAIKVSKASNLEKRGEFKEAINAWLEVSDMSLKCSKTRGIDSSFRNMLIKKTENMLEHVKVLKLKLANNEINLEEPLFEETTIESNVLSGNSQETEELQNSNHLINDTSEGLEQIHGGFVEIKAPKNFEIVTPHEEIDMEIFKDNKPIKINDGNEPLINQKDTEQQEDKKISVCFACGYDKNPPGAKKCKNCNTEL